MNPPFRAEHVGSLLRPAELLAARASHAEGKITEPELRAIEDRAILAAQAASAQSASMSTPTAKCAAAPG